MQQSSAWFTALDGAGITIRVDPVERTALPPWIAQRLAAQGQHVARAPTGQRTLAFFADRVEGNLLAAHQEIQKLALLYPPGELSFEQIETAVLNVARYDVFRLGEAVLAGQVARALRMLDGLRSEGEAAVLVHWTLAEDIRGAEARQGRARRRQAAAAGAARGAGLGREGARVRARGDADERIGARPSARGRARLRRPGQGPEASRLAARPVGGVEAAGADARGADRARRHASRSRASRCAR